MINNSQSGCAKHVVIVTIAVAILAVAIFYLVK